MSCRVCFLCESNNFARNFDSFIKSKDHLTQIKIIEKSVSILNKLKYFCYDQYLSFSKNVVFFNKRNLTGS